MNRSIYHVQKDSVENIADMLARSSLSLGDRVCVADAETGETVYELTAYPSTLLSNWRIVAGRGFTPASSGAIAPAGGVAGVASFKSRTGAISPMAGDYSAAQVSVAPAGALAATDVQAALVELDGEASALTAKVTAVEGKAETLNAKLATLDAKVADAQTKGAGVASFKSRTGAIVPQTGDYSAAQVSVAPAGNLAASDVQAALVELDGEASALSAKVTAIEGKANAAASKLKTLDALDGKVTTLEAQVADAQTKGAGVAGVASFKSRTGAIVPQTGDYSADQVSVTPSGGLAAADVQAALVELDGEASALSAKVTAIEGKANAAASKLKTLDALDGKVTTLEAQVADAQTKGAGVAGVASFKSRTGAIVPQTGDYSADQVSVTPSGGLAATDVQEALVELDGEASALTAKVTAVERKVAETQAKAGVTSFKSRTGAIAPQPGDYSADYVSFTPASGMASRDVQSALLELNRKGGSADQINVRPSSTLVATNVQAALTELDQKKLNLSVTALGEATAADADWLTVWNSYNNYPAKTMVGKLFTARTLVNPLLIGYRETVESQTVTTAAHALSDISLGNVKRLTLTVDTILTLPSLYSLPSGVGACLSVIIVQDNTGNRSVTFQAYSGQSIVWDCNTSQPAIADGPNEETMFSFYYVSGTTVWKGVRTHKGG